MIELRNKTKNQDISGSIIDELDKLDENSRFWKTPTTQRSVQGGVIDSILEIFNSIFYSIYVIIIARGLTSDAALLAIIGTLIIMLQFFAYLGFTAAGSKYLSEYLAKDKNIARIYAKAACKYNFLLTGIPLIAFAIFLYLTQPENEIERIAYLSLVITIIADRLRSNTSIYILGYKRQDLAACSFWIPDTIMYVFSIITYLIFGVIGPLISFSVFQIIMLITSLIAMKKCSDFPFSDMFAWFEHYGLFFKLFKFNFLYSLANLAFALLTSTLLISGGDMLNVLTASEIAALYMLTSLINPLFNFFNIVGPMMQGAAEAYALKNKKLLKNYILISLKFPLFLLIAYIAFIILFGKEIIAFFYGERWILLGMTILIILLPGYLFGAFASRFDNIIAGVNRPQTVIIPWMSALFIAIISLYIAKFLPDIHLIDYFVSGDPENYGISIRFLFTTCLTSSAMVIFGLIIMKICLKILDVKIPSDYLGKPIFLAIILMLFFYILNYLGASKIWINVFGKEIGGILYVLVMAVIGIFLYVSLSIIFDAMNIEDARFWAQIIKRLGPFSFIYSIIKPYAKFLYKHQVKVFKTEQIEWITSYDKETLLKDALFQIEIILIPKPHYNYNKSYKKINIPRDLDLFFNIKFKNLKVNLYNLSFYAQIDNKIIKSSIFTLNELINNNKDFELEFNFKIPNNINSGNHELNIVIEAFEIPRFSKTKNKIKEPKNYILSGFKAYVDTRFQWIHEEEYKLFIL